MTSEAAADSRAAYSLLMHHKLLRLPVNLPSPISLAKLLSDKLLQEQKLVITDHTGKNGS